MGGDYPEKILASDPSRGSDQETFSAKSLLRRDVLRILHRWPLKLVQKVARPIMALFYGVFAGGAWVPDVGDLESVFV